MNQIKTGIVLAYISIILTILVNILYTPFLIRMLGQSEYGLFSLAFSVVGYLTILDLGFGNAIIRYTAKFNADGNYHKSYQMFGMFFIIYSIIGIIALFLGGGISFFSDSIFSNSMTLDESSKMKIMLIIMSLNLAFTFPLSIFRGIVSAYERFIFQKSLSLLQTFITPLIMVILLLYGYKSIGVVIMLSIINLLVLLINAYYSLYYLKVKFIFSKFDTKLLKEVVIYSLWMFLIIIVDKIYSITGQFILGVYSTLAEVAVFALAVKISAMYTILSTAISGVFLPKVANMISNKVSNKDISDLFIKVSRIQYIILILFLAGFIVFGRQFINIWVGDEYSKTYVISIILLVFSITPLSQNLALVILQVRNKMKFRAVSYIFIAALSLFVSVALVGKYGGIGCAIGNAVGLLLGQHLIMNIYYNKVLKLDIVKYWREVSKITIVSAILVFSYICFYNETYQPELTNLIYNIIFFTTIFMGILWLFILNNYEKNLLKSIILKFKSEQ